MATCSAGPAICIADITWTSGSTAYVSCGNGSYSFLNPNRSKHPAGFYTLRITAKEGTVTVKIIKQ